MLGGRLVHLVFHFEHDGHVLHVIFVVTEDEVSLAATGCVVVLFEVGLREQNPKLAFENSATVGLQALANHLGG